MSTTDTDNQNTETAERPFVVREFVAQMSAGDGRTVDVRIVPYGVAAEVSDDGRNFYREKWDDHAFDDQLVAGHRLKVLLNFEHLSGISNIVGRGVSLRSVVGDGLHGSFRMDDGPDGDKALGLVNDGILDSVSLEAYPKKSVRSADGTVNRVKAHLRNVALCRTPAFSDAKVLAIREAPIFDEADLPVDMAPELVDRCRRLGIKLPQRYQAPPDTAGTPAESGTPEDGTRQPTGTQSSEEQGHERNTE